MLNLIGLNSRKLQHAVFLPFTARRLGLIAFIIQLLLFIRNKRYHWLIWFTSTLECKSREVFLPQNSTVTGFKVQGCVVYLYHFAESAFIKTTDPVEKKKSK